MRAERSALFLPDYYTTPNPICQELFQNFLIFFLFPIRFSVRHALSIGKRYKKRCQFRCNFLTHMLFHKNICRFSSQLNIYKSTFLLYNIWCWRAIVRQVPLFCTSLSVFAKCQAYDTAAHQQSRCAIFILTLLFHKKQKWQGRNPIAGPFPICL